MNKSISAVYAWIAIIVLSTVPAQSMETSFKKYEQSSYVKTSADRAEEYNDSDCLLLSLPNEKLIDIFSHCLVEDADKTKSLEKSIKYFMHIQVVCKNFMKALTCERIGHACRGYTQANKTEFLHELMKDTRRDKYGFDLNFLPVLTLIYAGVATDFFFDKGASFLKHRVMLIEHSDFSTALIKHHTNPNEKCWEVPLFFYAKTTALAERCSKNGARIHETDYYDKNVLWYVVAYHEYSSEMLDFYLKRGADPKKLNRSYCLLHKLAEEAYIGNISSYLRKGKLLLDAMPGMVNTLNWLGETPRDIAEKMLQAFRSTAQTMSELYSSDINQQMHTTHCYKRHLRQAEACNQLIDLFKTYGGVTAQELIQQAAALKG